MDILLVSLMSALAGFVDAVVGGGGLILVPALFAAYPTAHPASLLGTNKSASVWGTLFAAWHYNRRVTLDWRALLWASALAFIGSWAGAYLLTLVSPYYLRQALPAVLIALLVYTLWHKQLGQTHAPRFQARKQALYMAMIGCTIGFYDGFFGPGTGSFLVFYPEIDRGLNPELVSPSVKHSPPSVQAWFDHLHAQFPQRKGPWRIEIPRSTDQVVFARYLKPEETDPNVFAPMVVALDPDSGAVLNARMWGDYLVTWVYDLHYSLLMGKLGTVLVSLLGMALLVSVVLGVYLWLPRGKQRLIKAVPKVRTGSKKAIYDMHSYTGAYGAVLLLLMVVTGVGLATPQWVEPVVNLFSVRMEKQTVYSAIPMPGANRITADQAISAGLAVFPTAKLRWIEAPIKVEDVYVLRLQQPAETSQRFPKTFV